MLISHSILNRFWNNFGLLRALYSRGGFAPQGPSAPEGSKLRPSAPVFKKCGQTDTYTHAHTHTPGLFIIDRSTSNTIYSPTKNLRNKSKGCFRNGCPFLTHLVFRLKLSDITFRNCRALNFSNKCLIHTYIHTHGQSNS